MAIDTNLDEALKKLWDGEIELEDFKVLWPEVPKERILKACPRRRYQSDVARDPQGRLTSREALEAEREERRSKARPPAKPGTCPRIRVRRDGTIEKGD